MFNYRNRFSLGDLGFASAQSAQPEKVAFVPVPAAVFAIGGGLQPWQAALLYWARQRATWVARRPSRWAAVERMHVN